MMRRGRAFWVSLLCLAAWGQAAALREPSASGSQGASKQAWVEETLASMSLAEKVGQLIVGGAPSTYTPLDSESFKRIREEIERWHLGGYHAFRGDLYSASFLIRRMQEAARIPLLITADLEAGTGLIFEGGTRFPRHMALAATGKPELARQAAAITAQEARLLGVHVNFAPVTDVNSNPENPIINIRSFGEDPESVGAMAAAYIEGIQSNGLLATAKHFPGHGDTAADSHLELATVDAPLEQLQRIDLIPFEKSIQAGVAAIMTAHLSVPALEPNPKLPATLSKRILSDLLRERMGFQGLIFTDAMNMAGVTSHYSVGEGAVRAIEAGADLVLFPVSVAKAHDGLLKAVRSGRLSKERIEASVRRILAAKARVGLDEYAPPDPSEIDAFVGSEKHREMAREMMEAAITVVRDEKSALPLRPGRNSTVLIFTMLDSKRRSESRGAAFLREFRDYHRRVVHFEIDPDASDQEIRLAIELSKRVGAVVTAAYIRVAAFKGEIDLAPSHLKLLEGLSALERPFAFVLFGSPYLLSSAPSLPSYVVAYDDYPAAEAAAVRILLGRSTRQGRLPISLPGFHEVGHGIGSGPGQR